MKVLGPAHHDGFTMKQLHAARLLGYITSSLVQFSSALDSLRESGMHVQESAKKLKNLADSTKREVHIEKKAVEAFRARLSSTLALAVFMSRLSLCGFHCTAILSVHEGLPTSPA